MPISALSRLAACRCTRASTPKRHCRPRAAPAHLGQGYRSTVLRRLSSLGAQTAIACGPILQLDEALLAAAALPAISDVRPYAHAALGHLLEAAAQP